MSPFTPFRMLEALWRSLLARLGSVLKRHRFEDDLDEELAFHFEMEIAKNVRSGMAPDEARLAAQRAFGGVARVKEDVRRARGLSLADALAQDLRSAARGLRRSPGFTVVVALTLGLGTGANTAMFTMVRDLLVRPLPYENASRLLFLHQKGHEPGAPDGDLAFSVSELDDYRRESRTLESLVEYHSMPFTLLGDGEPERVTTGVVSAGFFEVLGVTPILGRTFLPGEDQSGAAPVLVLSHDYWLRRYGADPAIVGRVLEMNDRRHRVVGVLPPLPRFPDRNDVYMPTSSCPFRSNPEFIARRDSRMMAALGRLRPGVGADEARHELTTIAAEIRAGHPDVYGALEDYRIEATPLTEELTRRAAPVLVLLAATAIFVLVIAISNVLNLTLAQLSSRHRELSLRTAIGADRWRLARQFVAESTLLATAGGALGLVFAGAGRGLLRSLAERLSPRSAELGVDGSVFAFTLGLSLATGLVLGLVPLLVSNWKWGDHRGPRTRSLLVVAQVAISLVLLSGAGLTLKSLYRLESVDAGFETEKVLSMLVDLDWTRYREDEPIREFQTELLARVSRIPGVRSAGLGRTLPLSRREQPWLEPLLLEPSTPPASGGSPERPVLPVLDVHVVSPDYFRTIGIPVVAGRAFSPDDTAESSLVAVVNQSAAREYWGGTSPLGPIGKKLSGGDDRWYTIVGVVGDVRQYGLDTDARASVYLPLAQVPLRVTNLVVRTASDPMTMVSAIAEAVRAMDPGQALAYASSLDEVRRESLATPRLTAVLLSLFAALAISITAVGLGGALALTVRRRSREIGLRLAFGASPRDVRLLVLRQGALMLGAGLALGLPVAIGLSSLLSGLLFEVGPHDPTTYSVACLFLLVVVGMASLVPLRRASAIDPMTTLRVS